MTGLARIALTTHGAPNSIGGDFFTVALWTVMVPVSGGFVPQNEADLGPRINLYPWIIPTAIILFFTVSKGWRWFGRSR